MFRYNIINTPSFLDKLNYIDKIFLTISNIVRKEQNGVLNIVFLDGVSIKELNNKYRKINKTTDVLSFHYYSDFKNLKFDEISGEIILNEEKIISQAKEYKVSKENEFYKLLIHSCLHILGYNHEIENDYKQMSKKENQIWQEVFEK